MELPPPTDLTGNTWIRLAPCERAALEMLRTALREREDMGGRLALEGLGLFSVRHGDDVDAYLSPGAAALLAPQLAGLAPAPSNPPPDAPGVKLEEGDTTLWVAVVRSGGRRHEA